MHTKIWPGLWFTSTPKLEPVILAQQVDRNSIQNQERKNHVYTTRKVWNLLQFRYFTIKQQTYQSGFQGL